MDHHPRSRGRCMCSSLKMSAAEYLYSRMVRGQEY